MTADAQIAVFDAKYLHLRWRPLTAIRSGGVPGGVSGGAAPDRGWTPLVTNPQHPEHPGGHSTYAGAAERVLARLVGPAPDRPIRLVNPSNGEARVYTAWRDMTRDNVDGRVWSGIHFRFSDGAGARLGSRVAAWDLSRAGRLFT